jgi:basic membrane lipoprotein Med (substrate-binding protein (PBP1-ABC) superfamily)
LSYVEYEKAKKLGEKAVKEAKQEGKSPNPAVLDEVLQGAKIRGEVNLGLVTIPLDRIVGTATAGRANSFACNFMPILEKDTEFAMKWSALCDAHMEEGIHDPIKVYEYLNYYYVLEGNKRASVLKYFDSVNVPALVTRKIPVKSDDPEIRIYYEFMDFNRKTGVNFIWFSKEGNFHRLLEVTGTDMSAPELTWTDEQVQNLTSAYYKFSKAYEEKGGKKLENITTGDAFLRTIQVYDYETVVGMNIAEIKTVLAKMWEEFLMMNQGQEVTVTLDPPTTKKTLLSRVLHSEPSEEKPLNVAFIYDRDPSTSDWLYSHELGRNHIKEVFGNKVNTLKITTADTEEKTILAMEELIRDEGTEVIFTTTSQMIEPSLKVAVEHPEVRVLNCSLNTSHRYIRTYYARLYEAKFLSGMLAGILTKTNRIGYLADYPIYGVTANINAFAIGARMVNPEVQVLLEWTTRKDDISKDALYQSFYNNGVDYVSDQDMITPRHASRKFGMYRLTEGQPVNVAMPVVNWGVLYERIIRLIIDGAWEKTDAPSDDKAINYWWGLSSGVIDVILSEKTPAPTARLIELMKKSIIDERFAPFTGEIRDQEGEVRCKEGEALTAEEIMKMDWLVDCVVGEIPVVESLKEKARNIVELKGVRKDEDEDPGDR